VFVRHWRVIGGVGTLYGGMWLSFCLLDRQRRRLNNVLSFPAGANRETSRSRRPVIKTIRGAAVAFIFWFLYTAAGQR